MTWLLSTCSAQRAENSYDGAIDGSALPQSCGIPESKRLCGKIKSLDEIIRENISEKHMILLSPASDLGVHFNPDEGGGGGGKGKKKRNKVKTKRIR
jgi:hypothetical protein